MSGYGDFGSSLRDLPKLRSSRRGWASSWDKSGVDDDRITHKRDDDYSAVAYRHQTEPHKP